MNSLESILPLPVLALIGVGMISLVVLLMSKSFKPKTDKIQSKWKTSKAEAKPIYRGKVTREEVSKHIKPEDAWIIVDGKVYDITTYIDLHPGGCKSYHLVVFDNLGDAILRNVGADSSEGFHGSQHPVTVVDVIKEYYIGDLEI